MNAASLTPDNLPLPASWELPDADEAAGMLAELHREAIPGHRLHGLEVRVAGASTGTDDVLFQHLADPARYTVAHLTWSQRPEIDTDHPTIEFDGTFAEFLADQQYLADWIQANLPPLTTATGAPDACHTGFKEQPLILPRRQP